LSELDTDLPKDPFADADFVDDAREEAAIFAEGVGAAVDAALERKKG